VSVLPLFSQSFTGRILSTVIDPAGAVIPAASVRVTSLDTNRTVEVQTNDVGNYAVSNLERGEYQIEVSSPGFKRFVRRGIVLEIQQQAKVDVTLEVGEVSESVEVVGAAPLLETADSTLGKVVDNRRIVSLPLNSRNVYSLLYLTPGVTGSVSTTYSTGYGINGARNSQLDVMVDGVSTAHPTVNGFSGNSTFPPVDAIAEFKVLSTNYGAEFGRSNGGIVNVVYKAGTNEFHGSTLWFLRNSRLDANDFFNNRLGRELGSFKRNQFGAHVTGPIVKDRTFFLANYEGLRQRSFTSTTTTVPTPLQLSGDFTQTFASNGQLIKIFDPYTTGPNPAGGFIRAPFPDNIIPPNMIDPVARNVLKYYPAPNTTGDAVTSQNNYYNSGSRRFDQNQVDARVDDLQSQLLGQFVTGLFDQRRLKFDDSATLQAGEVIVSLGRHLVVMLLSLAIQYAFLNDARFLEHFQGAVNRSQADVRISFFGQRVNPLGVHMVVTLGQHLEQQPALAGHSSAGGLENLRHAFGEGHQRSPLIASDLQFHYNTDCAKVK